MADYNHPSLGMIRLQRRAGCKRISISVGRSGRVTVSYPWFVLRRAALAFVEQKLEWIAEAQKRISQREATLCINEGYSTHHHTLIIRYGAPKQRYIIERGNVVVELIGNNHLSIESQQFIKSALIETLRKEAHSILPEIIEEEAAKHSLRYSGYTIKNIRSKWGSCSSANHLNFSLYLMLLPDELIRFVVQHELCHTIHKNHSSEFHTMLNHLCDGRECELNRQLRSYRTSL